MYSFAVVAREVLEGVEEAGSPPTRKLLERLASNCLELQEAFLVLEQYRAKPLDDIQSATTTLTNVWRDQVETVRQLGERFQIPVMALQELTSERETYLHKILIELFDQFRTRRSESTTLATIPVETPLRTG